MPITQWNTNFKVDYSTDLINLLKLEARWGGHPVPTLNKCGTNGMAVHDEMVGNAASFDKLRTCFCPPYGSPIFD